jgi:hypothetical protein
VRLEGLDKLKKSTSSKIRTGDLPACSIVPLENVLVCSCPGKYLLSVRLREKCCLVFVYTETLFVPSCFLEMIYIRLIVHFEFHPFHLFLDEACSVARRH